MNFELLLAHLRELVRTYKMTPNRVVTFRPSYLALHPSAKGRQRRYRTLLTPSADPHADARDPRWSTQRAVGSLAFLSRHLPHKTVPHKTVPGTDEGLNGGIR